MRIVCWNCNGLRTLRQYRPWYALKDWKECLDHLEADIICFQEAKLTRKDLVAHHRDMCLPAGYEAYYSLHPSKGYSGVATFVKTETCEAQKAEMGLTGELVADRRDAHKSIGGYPEERAIESPLYDVIDAEGRAVVVDCGLFVLVSVQPGMQSRHHRRGADRRAQFNLYCPNETDEGRRDYKMAYSYTLAERVGNLIAMGREVVIVGDLNIAHLPIDHCKNVNRVTREEHLDEHPARRWLDHFLTPHGDFLDVTRHFHPTRRAMYTCWDTVKDTRPANYGARIDYILVTKGLQKWLKYGDIQPNIYGSDHCPIYADFHDQITGEDGSVVNIRDFLIGKATTKRKMPPLAAASWPEFSGRRLQSFFAGSHQAKAREATVEQTPNKPASPCSASESRVKEQRQEKGVKRSATEIASTPAKKQTTARKMTAGQTDLKTFFSKPSTPSASADAAAVPVTEAQSTQETATPAPSVQMDAAPGDATDGASRVESALAWGSIFARE